MPQRKETIRKINEMIEKVKFATLVTIDTHGKLQSRPMTTQQHEFVGDIWFFVSSDAELVREIKAMSRVNVAYSEDGKFVSISGDAEIVTDIAMKHEFWHSELRDWFDGKEVEDPDVLLLKITATEASYWEKGNGTVGNALRTLQAVLKTD